jgi:undecaprenyl-diphosphatase
MLAICLCFFKKHKWIVAPTAFYAIIMGFSRNYLIVHYPSDVLAAFIVGSVAAVIAFFLTKLIWKALQKHSDKKLFDLALSFDICSLFRKNKSESANDAQS